MAIDILTVDADNTETLATGNRAGFDDSPTREADVSVAEESGDLATTVDARDVQSMLQVQQGEISKSCVPGVRTAEADASGQMDQSPAVGEHAASAASTKSKSGWMSDFVQLTKPRIVVMILVTTVATAVIGAGGGIGWLQMLWLLLGTGCVAASAGAANQVWERSIDRRMARTANRPLPSGRLTWTVASVYTAALGLVGSLVLAYCFSWMPAVVGLLTWLVYVFVYTPMKTRTAWNTTVGAIAGAMPMLIGYTATGGLLGEATGWLLVGILVAWQYPHFMAIAWMYRKQYGEAGFRMSTTTDPSGRSAAIQSVVGSIALMLCGIVLCWIPDGSKGAIVSSLAIVLVGWPLMKASLLFATKRGDGEARSMMRKSLLVLPAVLAIVTFRLLW